MGTGKTYLIQKYIENLKWCNILAISPRKTFTQEFSQLLNFDTYEDTTEFNTTNKIITQIDCLYKFEGQFVECLIVDEIESVLSHITQNLEQQQN